MELNQRPTGYEPAALTAELRPHVDIIIAQPSDHRDNFPNLAIYITKTCHFPEVLVIAGVNL